MPPVMVFNPASPPSPPVQQKDKFKTNTLENHLAEKMCVPRLLGPEGGWC